MPQYTVLTPLRHDGRRYEPGAVVYVTTRQAAALLRIAALSETPLCGVGEEDSDTRSEPAATISIATAIPRLDPTDPSLWTRDGRPRTETLSSLLGRRVSARERDQSWQRWMKEKGR